MTFKRKVGKMDKYREGGSHVESADKEPRPDKDWRGIKGKYYDFGYSKAIADVEKIIEEILAYELIDDETIDNIKTKLAEMKNAK